MACRLHILIIAGLLLLAAPRIALAQANVTPMPPFNAWEIDADGNVYVLDAGQRIFLINPAPSAPASVSDAVGYGFTDSSAQMAADADLLYVRSDRFDGVKVLRRETLVEIETVPLDAAAVAVEPDKR